MSYTRQSTPPTEKSRLVREYAKMRTVAATANERLRPAYEKQANDKLKAAVEKERIHFQQQLDDYQKYAQDEINKAWQETDHWKKQCEIMYELLENQTQIAEDALRRLAQYETKKPVAEVINPKPKHKKGLSAAQRRHYEEER